jgi:dihydroorotase
VGVLHGVPTVVDAGGGGAWTYDDYRAYWEGYCKTDVYAFLHDNASGIFNGSREVLELGAHSRHPVPLADWEAVVERNRDRILAYKSGVHTYFGLGRVQAAHAVAAAVDLPLYLHVGDIRKPPGPIITREAIDSLRPGDVFTHVYTGNWGNLLDAEGVVYPQVKAAQRRGVFLDVGFGGNNFSFDALDKLVAQGIVTDVISSDLQGVNITGPACSLAHVMSIFLNHGFTLPEVVQRVTINPARAQRLQHRIGSLTPGFPARLTVFELQEGDWAFRDTKGGKRVGRTRIVPLFCVADGEVIPCDFEAGLAQENWSYMPWEEDGPAPNAAGLDPEQREFLGGLAAACQKTAWGDPRVLHRAFQEQVRASGVDSRKAADAVYHTLLQSRFCVPVGWLLNSLEREAVLRQLQGVVRGGEASASPS